MGIKTTPPGGCQGAAFPGIPGAARSGPQKLRRPSYPRVIGKTSKNQKTLRAPVTAPKGVRNRAAAPYHGVAEGSAALVIRLGNQWISLICLIPR